MQSRKNSAHDQLYYWPTSNGQKVALFLEEAGLPYKAFPVDISKGEQFAPEFLNISPNNRIPAIIDPKPGDRGEPLSLFDSGAILLYLAEKSGRFIGADVRGRADVLQWLFWQMGGLGPIAARHTTSGAPRPKRSHMQSSASPRRRHVSTMLLNARLADREFIAGEYSIADMACYPWTVSHERQGQRLEDFPHVKRWFEAITGRPAVSRAYSKGVGINPKANIPKGLAPAAST